MIHNLMEVDSLPSPSSPAKVRGSAGPSLGFLYHNKSKMSKRSRSPEESDPDAGRPFKRVAGKQFQDSRLSMNSSENTSQQEDWVQQTGGLRLDSPGFPPTGGDHIILNVNIGVPGPGPSTLARMDEDIDMELDTGSHFDQASSSRVSQPMQQFLQQRCNSMPSSTSRHPYGQWAQRTRNPDGSPMINVLPPTPADSLQSLSLPETLDPSVNPSLSTSQNLLMLQAQRTQMGTPPLSDSTTMTVSPRSVQEPSSMPSIATTKKRIAFGPRISAWNGQSSDRALANSDQIFFMSTTLPLFWHLSSASKNERLDASVKLISALERFQSQRVAAAVIADSSEDEEDQENVITKSRDDLDLLNAQDVSYSIRRLIRGLASPRESSRLGFAVALTELLSRMDTITCFQILDLIMDSTKPQGSMKGQEERDILFARLFGIISIVQSGLVVRTKPLPTSTSLEKPASSLESYEQIINSLISLAEQKSWLRESVWFAINLTVDAIHGSDVVWKKEAVEKTLDVLFVEHTVWSTEKLALVLKMQDIYPACDWKTYLSPTFKNANILSTGNLATISRILKESATDEDGAKDPTKAQSGSWKPQLNFSWDIILDHLLPDPNSKKATKGSFQDFYRVVVDETLFSSTSSANRKYWGFQVFQKALKKTNEESVPMLFTKNFMRTWINHLSKRDRYLHKVALQTVTEVQAFVKDKPQLGFALILQLTGVNGNQQFDKLTKTKTVDSILSSLDAKGVQTYIDYLLSQIDEPDLEPANVPAINSRRAWIVEQLAALIRNQKIPRDDSWIKNALEWLTIHGLFVIKKKSSKSPFSSLHSIPRPPFSDELRQTCRDRLLSSLGDLGNQTAVVTEGDATRKISGAASDGEFWISKVLSTIQLLEEDGKHVALVDELDEEERAMREKTRETAKRLKKLTDTRHEAARGAELLLLATLLIHYCNPDDEEDNGSDSLETCIDGVSRLLFTDGKQKVVIEGEPEPIDLLVDTIIGFLEKGTSYTRSIGNQVFSLLSKTVKESTVDLIVTQLERRYPGQLLNDDENEDEEMEEGGSGEELDSEESSEAGGSDHEDPDEESNEEETDPELRRKIEEALRVNGIEPATGETDSEEEELMDDDQMMAINEQLVQVFRLRANEKKGKNVDAQREATHFKSRILDLVDIYLKKEPSNPLALRFILPLVELVVSCGQDERQLADKAKGILRSRIRKAKDNSVGSDAAQVVKISATVHTLARKARSVDNLAILSSCSIYLAKLAIHAKAENTLLDLYKQDLVDFATRKNSALNGQFFQDFIQKYSSHAWCLRRDLLDLSKQAINAYRQTQLIQLLQILINLLPSFNPPDEEVTPFMMVLQQRLLEMAEDTCKDSGKLTTAQMKELLKLALIGVRQTARIAPKESLWMPDTWRSLNKKLETSSRYKSSPVLKKLCERIARSIEIPVVDAPKKQSKKASKRKAEQGPEVDITPQTKKQRRKTNS